MFWWLSHKPVVQSVLVLKKHRPLIFTLFVALDFLFCYLLFGEFNFVGILALGVLNLFELRNKACQNPQS